MSRVLEPVLVSACLLGAKVRYDGGDAGCSDPILDHWLAQGRVRALCPEVAGGLPTPRPPAEIEAGKSAGAVLALAALVRERSGSDVTRAFIVGAEVALERVRAEGIRVAVLKEGSPSCGSQLIADGHFAGRRIAGEGVTAAALRAAGVSVFSERQLEAAQAFLSAIEGPVNGAFAPSRDA